MSSRLRNRIPAFDFFLMIVPTVMIWWLFLPQFQLRKRLFGAAWAFAWVCLLRLATSYLAGPFHAITSIVMYLTLASIGGFGGYLLFGAVRGKLQMSRSIGMAEEAEEFFRAQGDVLQVISDPNIILSPGESIIYRELVEIYEYKQSGVSYSEGRAIRPFFGGPTIFRGRSERDTREVLTPCGEAVLCVTNARIIVLGRQQAVTKYIDQIVDLRAEQRFFVVSLSGLRKPLYLKAKNPFLPIGFCRLLINGQFNQMRLAG